MIPAKYETFLADLYQQLVAEVSIPVDVFIHRKFVGISGQPYDIDLGFEFEMAGVKYLTLIEAKYYSSRVEVGEVLEFHAKLLDINAHKGIFITKVGFQAGAIRIATKRKIALVVYSPDADSGHRTILEKPRDFLPQVSSTLASVILTEFVRLMSSIEHGDPDE